MIRGPARPQHRLLRLLDLQKERIVEVAAYAQESPAADADAADPHHLAGEIDASEPVEEHATIRRDRRAIAANDLVDRHLDFLRRGRRQLRQGHEQRRLDNEARLLRVGACERRKCAAAVVAARPLDDLRELAGQPPVVRGLQHVEHLCRVQARVPDVEVTKTREVAHCFAICPNAGEYDVLALGAVEPAVAAGDLEARCESFDVPFERTGKRLVEVVQVEDEIALR
jgi:hypothetical protein